MSSRSDDTKMGRREQLGQDRGDFLGMIRRMTIRLTSGSFWQAVGLLLLDRQTEETIQAEPFSNLGFYARPKSNANAEAIVVFPGGTPESAVIVATRDEDLRRKVANIEQDETIVFNSAVVVHHRGNHVEIRGASDPVGSGLKLPTLQDHENVRNTLNGFLNHQHQVSGVLPGAGAVVSAGPLVPQIPVPPPAGTSVLRAK